MQAIINNKKLIFILLAFIIFFSLIFYIVNNSPAKFFTSEIREGISLTRDNFEMGIYYDRASFYYNDGIPYKYSRIEYPALGTLYLTIPAFFSDMQTGYQTAILVQNIIFALIMVYLSYRLLETLGRSKRSLWLLLLPSYVYFAVNRFDIWPAALIQLALLLLFNKKFTWSFVVLSAALLAKGYALVFFPIFLIYYLNQTNKLSVNLFKNKYLYIFVLPTVIVLVLICLIVGWQNGIFPYFFQSTRSIAYGSIYMVFFQTLMPWLSTATFSSLMGLAAKALAFLQILLPLLLYTGYQIFRKFIKSSQEVILWMLAAVLLYLLFSPYYSPQWWVWIVPILVLLPFNKKEISLIIAYDIVNYLFFPVVVNYFNWPTPEFDFVVVIRTILLILIIIFMIKRMIKLRSSATIGLKGVV